MKKLLSLAIFASILSTTIVHAQVKQYTCHEIYAQQAEIAKHKRDKYNEKMNRVRGDLSNNDALTVVGLMAGLATGSTPVLLIGMLTPATISMIKNIPSKEERALRLEQETSKNFNRFLKRMKRKISDDVSKEEIVEILKSGFDSGEFCKDIGKLAGPAKMRKFVKDQLRVKHNKPKKTLKDVINGVFKKKGKADEICEDDAKEKLDLGVAHDESSKDDEEGDDLE